MLNEACSTINLSDEGGAAQLELWSFPGFILALSLFLGTARQFPLYEAVLWGSVVGTWACILYFKNDKGQTIVERGVDKLNVSNRAKTGLRFLAIVGIFHMTFLVGCNLPIQWFAMHGDNAWPALTGHLQVGLCGPDTDYVCPGVGIPINRMGEGGVIVTPDLTVIPQ